MIVPLIILPAPYLINPRAIMPLGILYIASYIEKMGDKCVIIDLSGVDDYINYTINKLKELNCSCVGISATSGQIHYGINLAKQIKKEFPDLKIIGGGPHFTHTYISYKKIPHRTQHFINDFNKYFDAYIIGDGEKAIYEATNTNKKVIDATIPGTPYYISSEVLNNMPFPARHLLDISSYHYDFGCKTIISKNAINIMSQRGCPYACRFCSSRMDNYSRMIRKAVFQKTIEEMKHLHLTYGYTDFAFYDDELNIGPDFDRFLNGLTSLQYDLGVSFRFRAFLRSDLSTKKQMKMLKDVGFVVAIIGAESGSKRILQNMNKKASLEQNTRFIEYAREVGIYAKCIMSIGHPGESNETLEETQKWMEKVTPDDANFNIITCLPSSHYHDYAIKSDKGVWTYIAPETGDKLYSFEVDFHNKVNILNGNHTYGYESTVYTDFLKPDDLVEWHKHLEISFKKT